MNRSTNGGVGWVSRNAVLIIESAHPSKKSAINFVDASIHRLIKETLRTIARTRD
jgi:hypothetical protein